jgi:hypothetical protein
MKILSETHPSLSAAAQKVFITANGEGPIVVIQDLMEFFSLFLLESMVLSLKHVLKGVYADILKNE